MRDKDVPDSGNLLQMMERGQIDSVPRVVRDPITSNRLAVVENVYFHPVDDDAIQIESVYNRFIKSDELPYSRTTNVDGEWKQLEPGWVQEASLLIVRNLEGRFTQTIPTPEERKEAEAKVLVLAVSLQTSKEPTMPIAVLLPGESLRYTPWDCTKLWIRCQAGTAKYNFQFFPK